MKHCKILKLCSLSIIIILLSVTFSIQARTSADSSNRNSRLQAERRARVEEIISSMSIREKVAQLFVIEIDRREDSATLMEQDTLIRDCGVGSLIVMGGYTRKFVPRLNQLQTMSKYPLLVCIDGEWGAAMRLKEYKPYQRQAHFGRLDNAEDLLYKMGVNVGKELKDLNILVNFAPVADICPEKYLLFDSQRSFGNDPSQVERYATAYMLGMQDAGIYACGKHYPGHGDTEVDSHKALPVMNFTKERLDSIEYVPFKKMINNGLAMMMIAHLCIPAIDSSGLPMSLSSKCVRDLLQKEHGFKGVVITDALAMKGARGDMAQVDVDVLAYKAGVEMFLMSTTPAESIAAITDSVSRYMQYVSVELPGRPSNDFTLEDLNNRVRKVLMLKANAGYFDDGFSPIIKNVERKIRRAARRDGRLQRRIQKALDASPKPALPTIDRDHTRQLDKGEPIKR